nr:MAG TPA: hypothetical protein [Caudoviricetes sp.]
MNVEFWLLTRLSERKQDTLSAQQFVMQMILKNQYPQRLRLILQLLLRRISEVQLPIIVDTTSVACLI